jgi:hypothetical protein
VKIGGLFYILNKGYSKNGQLFLSKKCVCTKKVLIFASRKEQSYMEKFISIIKGLPGVFILSSDYGRSKYDNISWLGIENDRRNMSNDMKHIFADFGKSVNKAKLKAH